MTSTITLRLDHLSLHNFRCFAECTIDLHPQLTVLVAENGRGKTAVLDAIGIALGLFVDTLSETREYADFHRSDVRLVWEDHTMRPTPPTEFVANGSLAGDPIHWSRMIKGVGSRSRTTTKDAEAFHQAVKHLRDRVSTYTAEELESPLILPLVAYYGTERLWNEEQLTKRRSARGIIPIGRMSGYADCLSSSSSVKGVVEWYKSMMDAARDPRSSALSPMERPEKLLAAVRDATRVVLAPTGWCELDWDFEEQLLVVEHPEQGRLPLSALSDGVRNMVALVADIARRCASLNPHLGEQAATQTPGILLIDEVDLHLHPSWQQQVIELLRTAFPMLQMVLSTHSPHVLSTVDVNSIRTIRLRGGVGLLETPGFQTRGVESADVLAKIMGVDPIPQVAEAQGLSDYRALVQTGQYETDDARHLWDHLIKHFGEEHPVIQEIETLQRLQEFKRMHNLPQREEP